MKIKKISFLALFTIIIFSTRNGYAQENLTFTVNGETFTMIFVEGGSFIMGCTPEQGNCYEGERPTHKVTLTDFYMGEFEVTQKFWHVIMGTNLREQWLANEMHKEGGGYIVTASKKIDGVVIPGQVLFTADERSKTISLYGEGENYPIYFINYVDCEQFCNRLNQLLADQLPEGYKFRIPTEAQWEYAARGGKMSRNYTFSGSNNIDEVAWYDTNSEEKTREVGKRIKNELGIYDMSGNVWEWCRDRYNANYYSRSAFINPLGSEKGNEYVLRGGSWNQKDWSCRIATRHKAEPIAYTNNYGFRLALEHPSKLSNSGFSGHPGNILIPHITAGENITFTANDVGFDMIFVEGGTFVMGCDFEQNKHSTSVVFVCDSTEAPIHKVKLSNYYLGKFEVTQKLWNAVMGTTIQQQRDLANVNWKIYNEGDLYPMYYVSYEECEKFCEQLNKTLHNQLPENYCFILPTEAQWEYAARGGSKNKNYIFSGSHNINKVAWWEGNSEKGISEVGRKFSNDLGIYDMSGNVWEWCRDWFDPDYYSYGSTTNPQGALFGTQRILRGGAWNNKEWHSRITTRFYNEPRVRSANLGFRIALMPAKDFFDVKSLKNAVQQVSSRNSSANNYNFKIHDIYFEMVFVEGGTFTMGCTSDPNDCFANEEPTHSVTLSDYYIGKYQVTQQLWTKVMGTSVRQQRNFLDSTSTLSLYGEGDFYPMYYINYKDCEEFCDKLNQELSNLLPEGYKFALPTEAQWEYAARGGKKSKGYIYSGSDNLTKVAWFEENSEDQTREIGRQKKNELGIYEMSGNLWEWCRDWFDGEYYNYSPSVNPTGPAHGYVRALRGGSWRSIPQGCRVSCRFATSPNERASNCGLRIVLVK